MFQNILNIYQSTPITIPFFGIYYGLLTVNYWLLAFGISAIASHFMNNIIKVIFKFIYNVIKSDSIPLLGIGVRPKDAKNCSAFTNCKKCDIYPKSFGMPSGHSQLAWFCFTYGMLYMVEHITQKYTFEKDLVKRRIWFIIGFIIMFLMAITLSYSRVYLKCHTVQQVIIGGLFGIGFGVLLYWISAMIIYQDKNVDFIKLFKQF
jgi:membrane-associated phospholipid phosphatase